MRPISVLLPAALLCMAALVPATAEAVSPRQAVFVVTASGRYRYDRVIDTQPGSDCVQHRGHAEDHKSFRFRLRQRVTIQTTGSRWYLDPIGHGGRFLGKGRLSDVVTPSFEVNYGCDGPAAWEREDPPFDARPRSLRCSTRMPMIAGIFGKRVTLYPEDRAGRCRFQEDHYVFFPPDVLGLHATWKRMNLSRLAGNSKRPFVVKVDKRRDAKPRVERDEDGTTTTTTRSAAASWKLTFRRVGRWGPWR